MAGYPVQPRERIFVKKGHAFLSFTKNMGKVLLKIQIKH